MSTIKLTMAQAVVRFLCNQFTIEDGKRVPLCGGVFAIFGHGNVTCLGEALQPVQDILPTWRGQNEQSMAMAAIAYARGQAPSALHDRCFLDRPGRDEYGDCRRGGAFQSPSTAAAFRRRLRQSDARSGAATGREFRRPNLNVNDCFKPVTRYWDRITHPGQIMSSVAAGARRLCSIRPTCGPAFLGLCQDVQEMAFDYPASLLRAQKCIGIARPRADVDQIADAIDASEEREAPLIISGGGVRYSLAEEALAISRCGAAFPSPKRLPARRPLRRPPLRAGTVGVLGTAPPTSRRARPTSSSLSAPVCRISSQARGPRSHRKRVSLR